MNTYLTRESALRISLAGLALGAVMSATPALAAQVVQDPGLTPYEVVDHAIPKSLTGTPGDPAAGKKTFINRKAGNCLTCHTAPIPEEQFHGNVAPDLTGVAGRLTEGEIRLRVVNAKIDNPESVMPAFYRTSGMQQILKGFEDKPILTAQEVEDVVAYLMTLK